MVTLSTTATVVMALVVAAALVAMVLVLASAGRSSRAVTIEGPRVERADARVPGMDHTSAARAAAAVGDDIDLEEGVEPGGHSVRSAVLQPVAETPAPAVPAGHLGRSTSGSQPSDSPREDHTPPRRVGKPPAATPFGLEHGTESEPESPSTAGDRRPRSRSSDPHKLLAIGLTVLAAVSALTRKTKR